MKIFISHSSRDRWISSRISEDLNQIGAETYLAENDMSTGDSIEEEILKHLKVCDELLLILSPTSLKSLWVLIEIGGAKAHGMRLSTLLVHVESSEVPHLLSKHFLRDLNEIEKYYKEVRSRLNRDDDEPTLM